MASPCSSRSDIGEKAIDLAGEIIRLPGQLLGGTQYLGGRGAGVVGRLLHAGDVRGDLPGAVVGLLDVPGDFLRRRALPFDRGGDRAADLVDLANDVDDVSDRRDRLVACPLDRRDLLGYFR